ncbi:MAG: hypothetical protein F6K26_20140 [Moorea sp. SIO2I5]|nr:hypothetical protein [Moorena sp. SIO2I5]
MANVYQVSFMKESVVYCATQGHRNILGLQATNYQLPWDHVSDPEHLY